MADNTIRFRATLDDKVSSSLSRIRDNFNQIGGKGTAASLFGNIGAKAAGAALGLVGMAASKVVDVLGDATTATLEEQVSIQKMGTSLRANVKDWDGNTAAIERVLQSRMALGFSDDEQRDSLAKLVVATKDVNKALDIQRTAMDLARLKGISLAEASTALIKVEGGQFRALKALGIVLKEGATATDALRAVQKAAAGQAADYAQTNAGKLLVSQIKVGEAMEKLGAVTMPIVVAATQAAADVATDLAGNLEGLTGVADTVGKAMGQAGSSSFDFVHAVQDLLAIVNPTKLSGTFGVMLDILDKIGISTDASRAQLAGWGFTVNKTMKDSSGDIDRMRAHVNDDMVKTGAAFDTVGERATELAKDMKYSANVGQTTFREMRDKIIGAASDIVHNAYDILDWRAALSAANSELSAARRVLASKNSSKEEIAAAKDTVREVGRDQADLILKLTAAGVGATKEVTTAIAAMKARLATATGQERIAILAMLSALQAVEAQAQATFRQLLKVKPLMPKTGGGKNTPLAGGGPAFAGQTYTVGEQGPETLKMWPGGGGLVIPHASSASSGESFVPVSIPIVLDARVIGRVVDENLFYRQVASPR